eukprot:11046479-Prorocentrum_lima.AAC.1
MVIAAIIKEEAEQRTVEWNWHWHPTRLHRPLSAGPATSSPVTSSAHGRGRGRIATTTRPVLY